MTVVSVVDLDCPEFTAYLDTDASINTTTRRIVWKPGTPGFNQAALETAAANAIATLNTAETQLSASNGTWDAATPAQRTSLLLGLTRDVRALIRLALGLLDSPT